MSRVLFRLADARWLAVSAACLALAWPAQAQTDGSASQPAASSAKPSARKPAAKKPAARKAAPKASARKTAPAVAPGTLLIDVAVAASATARASSMLSWG